MTRPWLLKILPTRIVGSYLGKERNGKSHSSVKLAKRTDNRGVTTVYRKKALLRVNLPHSQDNVVGGKWKSREMLALLPFITAGHLTPKPQGLLSFCIPGRAYAG